MTPVQRQRRDAIFTLILLGMVVLTAVIIGLLVLWGDDSPPQDNPSANQASTPRPRPKPAKDLALGPVPDEGEANATEDPVQPTAPTVIAVPVPVGRSLPDITGETKFLRRLSFGTALETAKLLRRDEALDDEALTGYFGKHIDATLNLDRITPETKVVVKEAERLDAPSISKLLSVLTEPRRDTLAFQLRTAAAEEGPEVRLWGQPGMMMDEAAALEASAMLGHVYATIGLDRASQPRGFDVLYTLDMGTEFFPLAKIGHPNASGVYVIPDQTSMIRASLMPWQIKGVMKHELVHALTYQLSDTFETSRFVSEGLAEYIRLWNPGDEELKIPLDRVRNELATLHYLLEVMPLDGINTATLSMKALSSLEPDAFYTLGQFAYLTAQAAMFYVGNDTILKALKAGSDKAIVSKVERIDFTEFREWVRKNAEKGKAGSGFSVTDPVWDHGPPANPFVSKGGQDRFGEVMNAVGARVDANRRREVIDEFGSGFRRRVNATGVRLESTLSAVLGAMLENARKNRLQLFFAENTPKLNDSMVGQPFPRRDFPLKRNDLNLDNRYIFAVDLFKLLDEKNLRERPELFALTDPPTRMLPPLVVESTATFSLRMVPREINTYANRDPKNEVYDLIFCIASRDEISRNIVKADLLRNNVADANDETALQQVMIEVYASVLRREQLKAKNVLVVDLGDGESEALTFADALGRYFEGTETKVAYWNPEEEYAEPSR